jgi:hypothetical protein
VAPRNFRSRHHVGGPRGRAVRSAQKVHRAGGKDNRPGPHPSPGAAGLYNATIHLNPYLRQNFYGAGTWTYSRPVGHRARPTEPAGSEGWTGADRAKRVELFRAILGSRRRAGKGQTRAVRAASGRPGCRCLSCGTVSSQILVSFQRRSKTPQIWRFAAQLVPLRATFPRAFSGVARTNTTGGLSPSCGPCPGAVRGDVLREDFGCCWCRTTR